MNYRILLADDELHILRAAEFKLRRHGFHVLTANDGEEAWQVLQNEPVDLMITDFQMPRLNGLELIARMRDAPALKKLPVFMLTAKGFELPHDELSQALGIREIIDKPFSPRELCERVQAALAGAHVPAGPAGSSVAANGVNGALAEAAL